ncbi:SPOR domain-containing protein [bacterium]|nr:SPOR domain-containing protein [bacterium]
MNFRLKYLLIVLITMLSTSVGFCIDESWLFERFEAGDVDTIRALLIDLPENTAVGSFFRGVFETDAERARFYYDRVLTLWQGSESEAWALERLWQYHWSTGNTAQAERYYGFLKQRHPGHACLTKKPDFSTGSNVSELKYELETFSKRQQSRNGNYLKHGECPWRIQIGAFSKYAGARATADRVRKYGTVDLVEKVSNGRKLTVVMVGYLPDRREAQILADEILHETGLKGIPVMTEDE